MVILPKKKKNLTRRGKLPTIRVELDVQVLQNRACRKFLFWNVSMDNRCRQLDIIVLSIFFCVYCNVGLARAYTIIILNSNWFHGEINKCIGNIRGTPLDTRTWLAWPGKSGFRIPAFSTMAMRINGIDIRIDYFDMFT